MPSPAALPCFVAGYLSYMQNDFRWNGIVSVNGCPVRLPNPI